LAKTGFDRMYGARPLKRAIQRYVESPLSKRLIAGDFPEGSTVVIDAVDGAITFSSGDPDAAVEVHDDEKIEETDAAARQSDETEKESIAR